MLATSKRGRAWFSWTRLACLCRPRLKCTPFLFAECHGNTKLVGVVGLHAARAGADAVMAFVLQQPMVDRGNVIRAGRVAVALKRMHIPTQGSRHYERMYE